jgi:hypothetical protein
MKVDELGLPIQRDFDANDQLNRVGLLSLSSERWYQQLTKLQVTPGVYRRHGKADPNNVSGDQLVPVFAAAMRWDKREFGQLTLRMLGRFGFAQNTHDTDGTRKRLPDFLLPRVLPLITRAYLPSVLVCPFDILLVIQVLLALVPYKTMDDNFKLHRRSPDDVDQDVNLCATLYACNLKKSTLLSRVAVRIYEENRPESLGGSPSVEGALRWYHRSEAGGNPEVGEVQVTQWKRALAVAYGRMKLL